jgi:hypothetical protein
MRYYLDFDRTIFDTDAFKEYVRGLPGNEALQACSPEELGPAIVALKDLSFAPGELSRFLYPDAAQFLRDKENAVTIITFGDRAFQEAKAKSALYGIPRMSVMYTGDIRKGKHLAPHVHLHADAILVDDAPLELEILAAECPRLQLYEIRREGGEGDGRWPIIESLTELP